MRRTVSGTDDHRSDERATVGLVAHLFQDEGVAGSNPATPTIRQTPPRRPGADVRRWRCGARPLRFRKPSPARCHEPSADCGFGSLGHDFLPGRREERDGADEPSRRRPAGPGAVRLDCRRRLCPSGAPSDRARDGMACAVPDRVRRAPASVSHPGATGGAEPVLGPSQRADPVASEPCRLDGHSRTTSRTRRSIIWRSRLFPAPPRLRF